MRRPASRALAAALLACAGCGALVLACAGCGKKAAPLPPLRSVPAAVEGMRIRQVGERLIVSLPVPARRADGSRITSDSTLHLMMTAADPPPRQPMALVQTAPVSWALPAAAWDTYRQGSRLDIPISLATISRQLALADAGALHGRRLSFVAEVSEVQHRRSDPSDIETFPVCAPPAAPGHAGARVQEEGIALAWDPSPAGPVTIYRRQEGQPVSLAPYMVLPAGTGALLDAETLPGAPYTYTVRIAAAAGARCESADAAPLEAERVDLFPPQPPEALAVVAEHGGLRLFWRPGGEADLRGYRVYRGDGERGALQLKTPDLLTSSSWTDKDVTPGVVYIYVVTALDGAEPPNESGWSEPVIHKMEAGR